MWGSHESMTYGSRWYISNFGIFYWNRFYFYVALLYIIVAYFSTLTCKILIWGLNLILSHLEYGCILYISVFICPQNRESLLTTIRLVCITEGVQQYTIFMPACLFYSPFSSFLTHSTLLLLYHFIFSFSIIF